MEELFFRGLVHLIPVKISEILSLLRGCFSFSFLNYQYIFLVLIGILFNLILRGLKILDLVSARGADQHHAIFAVFWDHQALAGRTEFQETSP